MLNGYPRHIFPIFLDDNIMNWFKYHVASDLLKVFNHLHLNLLGCLLKIHFPELHFRFIESEFEDGIIPNSAYVAHDVFSVFSQFRDLIGKIFCV